MGIKEDFENLTPAKCLVAGFFLCVAYYFTMYDKGEVIKASTAAVQAEVDGLSKRLTSVQAALNNKLAFEEKVKAFSKELEDLLRFFPENLNINDMQKEFVDKLGKTNNTFSNITNINIESRFPGYVENGIELQMSGGFNDIMMFLSEITKMDRVVDFRYMEFNTEKQTDEVAIVRFKVNLSIFSKDKIKKEPSPGEVPPP